MVGPSFQSLSMNLSWWLRGESEEKVEEKQKETYESACHALSAVPSSLETPFMCKANYLRVGI